MLLSVGCCGRSFTSGQRDRTQQCQYGGWGVRKTWTHETGNGQDPGWVLPALRWQVRWDPPGPSLPLERRVPAQDAVMFGRWDMWRHWCFVSATLRHVKAVVFCVWDMSNIMCYRRDTSGQSKIMISLLRHRTCQADTYIYMFCPGDVPRHNIA